MKLIKQLIEDEVLYNEPDYLDFLDETDRYLVRIILGGSYANDLYFTDKEEGYIIYQCFKNRYKVFFETENKVFKCFKGYEITEEPLFLAPWYYKDSEADKQLDIFRFGKLMKPENEYYDCFEMDWSSTDSENLEEIDFGEEE